MTHQSQGVFQRASEGSSSTFVFGQSLEKKPKLKFTLRTVQATLMTTFAKVAVAPGTKCRGGPLCEVLLVDCAGWHLQNQLVQTGGKLRVP